nr:MAG: fiber protein [unidentified adenovirus]
MKRTLDLHYPFDVKRRRPMPPLLDEEGPLITTHEGTQLSVNTGYGVAVVNNQLVNSLQKLQGKTPLEVNNALVSLNLGNSLVVKNGKLEVRMQAPFLQGTDGLTLNLGAGLSMNGDQLVNSLQNLIALSPLTYSRDTLSMNLGSSLYIDSNNLQVRCLEPLSITSNGLSLNIGQGLQIDNGQLVGTNQTFYLKPLERTGDQVKLNLGQGLEVINNHLKVAAVAPLNLNQFGLSINLGHGLRINQDNLVVQPTVSPPITFDGTDIGLNVGAGLSVANSTLQISAAEPIVHGPDGLKINYGETLTVQNGKLQVAPLQPLNVTNSGLELALGQDFTIDNGALALAKPISFVEQPIKMQNGTISLNMGTSLVVNSGSLEVKTDGPIYNSSNGISIRTGEGLTVLNDMLQVSQMPVAMPLMYNQKELMIATGKSSSIVNDLLEVRGMAPLTVTDNGLELSLDPNSIFTLTNSSLSIMLNEPFSITTSGLSLNLGDGLGIDNGYLVNTAQVTHFNTPLSVSNNHLSVLLGQSLTVLNDKMELNITDPFEITDNGLRLRLGDGLTLQNGMLMNTEIKSYLTPLSNSTGTNEVGLNLGKSTTVIDNLLEIRTQNPFIIDSKGLNILLGNGLVVENGRLSVSNGTDIIYENPLNFNNNTLNLAIGQGLQIQNGTLVNSDVKYFNAPLQSQNGTVSLLIGEGLGIIGGKLVNTSPISNIALLPPLVNTISGITLNLGRGLTLLNNTLIVNLTSTYPLDLNDLGDFYLHYNSSLGLFGNQLGVKIGKGFSINSEGLQYVLEAPLKIKPSPTSKNGSLNLSIGQGLIVSPIGDLEVQIAQDKGLSFNLDNIAIKCESGLSFSSSGALMVNTGSGLNFGPLGDLNVNISGGLSFANDQSIKVNTGRGLNITGQSQVEIKPGNGLVFAASDELEVKIARGLKFDAKRSVEIELADQCGLGWSGNKLTTIIGPGLQIFQNEITIKNGHGILLEPTGHLGINANKGLTFVDNKLEANLGAGLAFGIAGDIEAHFNQQRGLRHTVGGLEVKLGSGLTFNTLGEIHNNVGRGLTIDNEQLELKLGNGLSYDSNGQVEISATFLPTIMPPLGNGLIMQQGNLTTAIGDGLKFIGNNMAVSVGNGLHINSDGQIELSDAFTSSSPFNLGQGLRLYQGNITVSLGEGMRFNLNNIEPRINTTRGLKMKDSQLEVSVGNGLAYEPNGTITLKIGNALQFDDNFTVHVKYGRGLVRVDNTLEPKLGMGLQFDINNRVTVALTNGLGWSEDGKIQTRIKQGLEFSGYDMKVKTGRGLRFEGMALEANLGAGLRFDDNGAIQTTPTTGVQGLPCLSTGDVKIFNIQWPGYSAPNVRLDLSLTMVGKTILATAKFRNFKHQFGHYIHPPTTLQCVLYFDDYGNLMTQSNLKGNLSWYDANTVDRRFMMPSREFYPKKTITGDTSMQTEVYTVSFDTTGTALLKIQYNCSKQTSEPNFTWSIILTLSNFTKEGDLNTGTCTFSYFHE